MVTVTITHEDGITSTYKNVLAWDLYDKDYCESIAGRGLTSKEITAIISELDFFEEITADTVRQAVIDVINGGIKDGNDN